MTDRFVGVGGNDGNSGLSYALRKLTWNGCEDTPVVPGDICHIAPGVYRELHTVDVSGGNTYAVGTVSLTNGSTTVTGAGTTFGGNVFATAGYFHVFYAENNTDGVVAGDNSFTSAGADFDAGHAGMIIQINAEGAYKIATVTDANTLVLSDPNGLGWPGPADPVTWSIMSGQGAYAIESVDGNTQLTLQHAWAGPTLDGLSYLTWQAIEYIADVTGEVTDGIGGIVRITGSDDDQSATRTNAITASGKLYRVFRGFRMDVCTQSVIRFNNASHGWVLEDLDVGPAVWACIASWNAERVTLRRSYLRGGSGSNGAMSVYQSSDLDDTSYVFENCIFHCGDRTEGIRNQNLGGGTVKNCLFLHGEEGVNLHASGTLGQTTVVANSVFVNLYLGMSAAVTGDIVEDYNGFYLCRTARTNVGVGGSSVTYPGLHAPFPLVPGYRLPISPIGSYSQWSQYVRKAGWVQYGVYDDFFGIARPSTAAGVKNSWGPVQFHDAERSTAQAEGGSVSIVLNDAGDVQFFVPVTAVETDFTVQVYREANYAGTNPRLIVRQPGQADDVTTDAAAAGQWNELTTTLTPDGDTDFVIVILRSLNSAAAGNYKTYFDTFTVD